MSSVVINESYWTQRITGQLTIGWVNDVVDRDRDRRADRRDKPVALGWIEPRTVVVATGLAVLALVPLSLARVRVLCVCVSHLPATQCHTHTARVSAADAAH